MARGMWQDERVVTASDEFYLTPRAARDAVEAIGDAARGKAVLCCCNDAPGTSHLLAELARAFDSLGLASLTGTSYVRGKAGAEAFTFRSVPHPADLAASLEADGNGVTPLEGNGDFRSPAVRRLIEASDVVITTPPAWLFPDMLDDIAYAGRLFMLCGPLGVSLAHPRVLPTLAAGLARVSSATMSRFAVTDEYERRAGEGGHARESRDGLVVDRLPERFAWFTNFADVPARPLELADGDGSGLPAYDGIDAVRVGRGGIPSERSGLMGADAEWLLPMLCDRIEVVGGVRGALDGRMPTVGGGRPVRHGERDVLFRLRR